MKTEAALLLFFISSTGILAAAVCIDMGSLIVLRFCQCGVSRFVGPLFGLFPAEKARSCSELPNPPYRSHRFGDFLPSKRNGQRAHVGSRPLIQKRETVRGVLQQDFVCCFTSLKILTRCFRERLEIAFWPSSQCMAWAID